METTVLKDPIEPLSKKLQPRPMREGERVVFRLLSIGKREAGREEPTAPEVYQVSARETVIDPFDEEGPKKKVIATEMIELRRYRGQSIPVYKNPKFIRGYCTLTHEDNPSYVRLLRSKHCRNNKFRTAMGTGKLIWELVEDDKTINDQLHLADLRYHAESIIRNGNASSMKATAVALRTSPDNRLHTKSFVPGVKENDFGALKLELISMAQLYPKQVIMASDNKEAIVRVQMFEAMNFGVLIFEDGAYHLMSGKKGELTSIFTPSADQDAPEALVKHLMTQAGNKDYVKLVSLLKDVMTPRTT